MVKFFSLSRILVSGAGIFLTFWFYESDQGSLAFLILSATTVIYSGLTGFITHVIYAKEDARRLGWEAGNKSFQYEVGFANLAFALAALVTLGVGMSNEAILIVIIGYALYLMQASILHFINYLTHRRETGYLVRSVLLPLVLEIMMLGFCLSGTGII
ncbi:MAG TPA: hypothetical protein DCR43_06410 [Bacteroidales bacterium]|nr:MAG: hypothetical protein A2X11_07825 [Bacteroidetes bacterium GWE2_42_24]OFY26456.1 MAG: hypothetical protein A2X09_02130 [Bacteroidetes bacterium GWF2_43_11]HAQ65466.1 hypothetical protein [Bacteroidales bacterium]HBZ68143.1 hypothetical protein [Bacteroidales bacterium]